MQAAMKGAEQLGLHHLRDVSMIAVIIPF